MGGRYTGTFIAAAILAAQGFLIWKIGSLGPRRAVVEGDPMGLWVGLSFLLWSGIFAAAAAAPNASWLLRYMGARGNATVLAVLFLVAAAFVLGLWSGFVQ